MLSPGRWYWLRFRAPASGRPLAGWRLDQSQDALRPLNYMEKPVFGFSPNLKDCFERLIEEYRQRRGDSSVMARSILQEFILWAGRDCAGGSVQVGQSNVASEDSVSASIRNVSAWLDANLAAPIQIPRLAELAGLSESHFRREFHRETGFSPSDYVMRRRIERAKEYLRSGQRPISEIGLELGFNTPAYFTSVFRKLTGKTPTEFRKGS